MGGTDADAAVIAQPAPGRRLGARLAAALLAERERWPLWLPSFMGAGIGIYFWLSVEPAVWWGPVSLLLAAAALVLAWRRPTWRWLAAAGLALALGFAAAQF